MLRDNHLKFINYKFINVWNFIKFKIYSSNKNYELI